MGLLFEGGDYSRVASDQGNKVHNTSDNLTTDNSPIIMVDHSHLVGVN